MFHSWGIVQSNTRVPVGTSCTVSGKCSLRMCSVSRTPSPVMLRQIGKSRAARACMAGPESKCRGAVTFVRGRPHPSDPPIAQIVLGLL